MGAIRSRYLAPTIPICTLHWTLTYLGTSMYIGPHMCMSGYVSAYHGVGKLCILLHTILCHAVNNGNERACIGLKSPSLQYVRITRNNRYFISVQENYGTRYKKKFWLCTIRTRESILRARDGGTYRFNMKCFSRVWKPIFL